MQPINMQLVDYVTVLDRTEIRDLGVNEPPRAVIVMQDGFRHVRRCQSLDEALRLGGEISRAANCELHSEINADAFQAIAPAGELPKRRAINLE